MPELPEVETIKKGLSEKIIGKKITGVDFLWEGLLKNISLMDFETQVIGKTIKSVDRRAKNISIELSGDKYLLFHMKMTGHLINTSGKNKVDSGGRWILADTVDENLSDPNNQFIRAIFGLSDGNILAFSDLRKFAYIKLLDKKEIEDVYKEYGPEPFSNEFTLSYFKKILDSSNAPIKKILMDQKKVAGIGNIYADEILWESCVHPLTKGCLLYDDEIAKVYKAIKEILSRAIKYGGTSTSDYRDVTGGKGKFGEHLNAYRRTGKPCYRDNGTIKRIVIGGRGSHFCPVCQKEKESC